MATGETLIETDKVIVGRITGRGTQHRDTSVVSQGVIK
jgi:hypothetical protein